MPLKRNNPLNYWNPQTNLPGDNIKPGSFIFLLGFLCLLILLAFAVNLYYQYPGNDYFPKNTKQWLLILILIYAGCRIVTNRNSRLTNLAKEYLYFFLSMSMIALATNAVQLTPFDTIDKIIILGDKKLHIDTLAILDWTYQHPRLQCLLAFAYGTLPWQMTVIPLLLIARGEFTLMRDYYFLLLCSVLFGFGIYYFFPTVAPASVLESNYFTEEQLATGLKFFQIHKHLPPATIDGGLIAFPSFHLIWAWLCLYLVRSWRIIFYPLLLLDSLLALSCVLLGWHYFADLLMSVFILCICHYLLHKSRPCAKLKKLSPISEQ